MLTSSPVGGGEVSHIDICPEYATSNPYAQNIPLRYGEQGGGITAYTHPLDEWQPETSATPRQLDDPEGSASSQTTHPRDKYADLTPRGGRISSCRGKLRHAYFPDWYEKYP